MVLWIRLGTKKPSTWSYSLKDLETVDKKLDKVKRAAKTGNKEAQAEEADFIQN